MDERLYPKHQTIRIDDADVLVPVVSNNPDRQELYSNYRQSGLTHADAESLVEDIRQTQYYEKFVGVVRHDGRLIQIPIYSEDQAIQKKYMTLRQIGESHNSADMAITGKGPGLGLTDSVLLSYDLLHNQFSAPLEDLRGDALAKEAKQRGISTTGKFYHPMLATHFGDAEAWVGSIDEIKQRCKRLGWECSIKGGELEIIQKADINKKVAEQFTATPVGT